MSTALTYIVVGCANLLGSQLTPNASTTAPSLNLSLEEGPVQVISTRIYNFSHTPDVGIHRVDTRRVNWNNARLTCEDQGGHLAIINSVAEAEVIAQMLNNSNIESAYVGVHHLYGEGAAVTIHGESLAKAGFEVWNGGKANNLGRNGECVVFDSNGRFSDFYCSNEMNFICEVPYVNSHVQQNPPLCKPALEVVNLDVA